MHIKLWHVNSYPNSDGAQLTAVEVRAWMNNYTYSKQVAELLIHALALAKPC